MASSMFPFLARTLREEARPNHISGGGYAVQPDLEITVAR